MSVPAAEPRKGPPTAAGTPQAGPTKVDPTRAAALAAGTAVAPAARFCGQVFQRATSGSREPPAGWVSPTAVSPWRDAAVGAVLRDQLGQLFLVDHARHLYDVNARAFMDAVRTSAIDYVDALLDRQVPVIQTLLDVVERDGERLRQASLAALRYSQTQRIDSASGVVAHPDEAAALARRRPGGPSVMDAFERVRFTRAAKVGEDRDLQKLMAHPQGVAILKAYARAMDEGTRAARSRLRESLVAIPTVRLRIRTDPLAIWRLPAAIAGGVERLGLARYPGTVAFAIAWAAIEGRTVVDKVLDTAMDAVALLDLLGPLGRLAGAVLDVVLTAAASGLALLREIEQDQAGAASGFAPDAAKLSAGGNYLGVAFQGVVGLAAAVALPGAISAVRGPRRVAATALHGATPAAAGGLAAREERRVPGRMPAKAEAEAGDIGTRATSGAERDVEDRGVSKAQRNVEDRGVSKAQRDVVERGASKADRAVPVEMDLSEDVMAFMHDPDELRRLQTTRPLPGANDVSERAIRDEAAKRVAASADSYHRAVAYGAGKRDKAIGFMNLDFMIDTDLMTTSLRSLTALGFKRNSRAFWRAMVREYPYLFSTKNKNLILRKNRAPRVDDQWLWFHPAQKDFVGDVLVHHHIEQGPMAAGIPEKVHHSFYPELHPITNDDVLD
jgi:hypothetical protein